jgi:hypothetical protein
LTLFHPPMNGLLALTSLALFGGISFYLLPLEPNLLALQFSFTQADFQTVLAQWQGDELRRFKLHFIADFALLACYGLWGYRWVRASAWLHNANWRSTLAWLLPLAALSDALENLLQLFLLEQSRAISWLYPLAGTAALLKWLLLTAFALLLGWAWARRTHVT